MPYDFFSACKNPLTKSASGIILFAKEYACMRVSGAQKVWQRKKKSNRRQLLTNTGRKIFHKMTTTGKACHKPLQLFL